MEEKKLKVALSIFGFVLISVVILAICNFQVSKPEVLEYSNTGKNETKNVEQKEKTNITTSSTTGDEEVDKEINSLVNEVVSDNEADQEIQDIDIILSEESEVTQINNLFNENEL